MKKFNAPEVEIRKFDTIDVLTTSVGGEDVPAESSTEAATTANPVTGTTAELIGQPCTGTAADDFIPACGAI